MRVEAPLRPWWDETANKKRPPGPDAPWFGVVEGKRPTVVAPYAVPEL